MDLHNLRIMITRPKPQGEELCQHILALGGEAIYFPTLEIVPIENPRYNLEQYDWIIFISPQAVNHFQVSSIPARVKVAAVGLGTARDLQKKGISVALYPAEEWSSEGLLKLPELQNLIGKSLLIVRGEGGREVLAQTLAARGAKVSHAIVYRRVIPKVDIKPITHLLQAHKIDIIVCTSSEGIRNLLQLLGTENEPPLLQVPMLVVSDRLSEIAKDLGFRRVIVAKNANHETILETLSQNKEDL